MYVPTGAGTQGDTEQSRSSQVNVAVRVRPGAACTGSRYSWVEAKLLTSRPVASSITAFSRGASRQVIGPRFLIVVVPFTVLPRRARPLVDGDGDDHVGKSASKASSKPSLTRRKRPGRRSG